MNPSQYQIVTDSFKQLGLWQVDKSLLTYKDVNFVIVKLIALVRELEDEIEDIKNEQMGDDL